MRFIKEWYDKTDNMWVMQFEVDEDEYATIQRIEAEQGRNFSDIISGWFAWLLANPEEGMKLMEKLREESDGRGS